MGDQQDRGSIASAHLITKFSWDTRVRLRILQKSAIFTHCSLAGVRWQLQLMLGSIFQPLSITLVMVSNDYFGNIAFPVKFTIESPLPQPALGQSKTAPASVACEMTDQLRELKVVLPIKDDTIKLRCAIQVTLPASMPSPVKAAGDLLAKLHYGEFQTDVQFVFEEDDERISAHKLLLSAKSPVFEQMFSDSTFKESRSNTVRIEDASFEAFNTFIQLIYDDVDEDTLQDDDLILAFDVLSIGHKYQVDSIVRRASLAIQGGLSNDTVLRAVEASQLYEDKELEEACASYIADGDNLKRLSRSVEWLPFIGRNASFINKVMSKVFPR